MLIFAETTNIAEKRRGSTHVGVSRKARSITKTKEIATIIVFSLKIVGFFVNGWIDSKIVDRYKDLQKHLQEAKDLTDKTEIFLNGFNGEKCLFYNNFEILNKSIKFFFFLQKFKNAINHFSAFIKKEDSEDDTDTGDDDAHNSIEQFYNSISKVRKQRLSHEKSLLQITEKTKTFRRTKNYLSKNSSKSNKKNLTSEIKNKLQEFINKVNENLPASQNKLTETFIILEEALTSIQQKTNKLLSLYCSAHVAGLSHSIHLMRKELTQELENVDKKINEKLKESNFFTNALQVGFFQTLKSTYGDPDGTVIDHEKSAGHNIAELTDQSVGMVDNMLGNVSDVMKTHAWVVFGKSEMAKNYPGLKLDDIMSILGGDKLDKFPFITKGMVETEFSKNIDFFNAQGHIDKISGSVFANLAAGTSAILTIYAIANKPDKNADDVEIFKRRMDIVKGFFGGVTSVLGNFADSVPVFNYASAINTVVEMVGKYLEYETVVQFVNKKIGRVNDMKDYMQMSTLKYMANEIHNRCDLLMHTYDVLNKNKDNFNKISQDSTLAELDNYIKLREQMRENRDTQIKISELSKEYIAQENQFLEIEKAFMTAVASNSAIVASESKIISAYTAYMHEQFNNTDELKTYKTYDLYSTYGPFNKLLVATNPESYKNLLSLGYEIIHYLGTPFNLKVIESRFNFLMGCRACGDEIVIDVVFKTLKQYREDNDYVEGEIPLQDKIKRANFQGKKIYYLTYEDSVIVYFTTDRKLDVKEKINPEKCFRYTWDGIKGIVDEDIFFHPSMIKSEITYCKNSYQETINETKFSNDIKLNTKKDLKYYLAIEFIDDNMKKRDEEDTLFLTYVKRKGGKVIYYLKPIDSEIKPPQIKPQEIQILDFSQFQYKILNNLDEKNTFFGKTMIPINHLFNHHNQELNEELKQLFKNLAVDGKNSDIIKVVYKLDKVTYEDHFIIYNKEKVTENMKSADYNAMISNNKSSSKKPANFLDSLESLRNNICSKESVCENLFIDGNRKERNESVMKELKEYNSFFEGDANKIKEKAENSSNPKTTLVYENYEDKKESKDPNLLNSILMKSYSGYFMDLRNSVFKVYDDTSEVKFVKNNDITIPPLMKIYGNDHNIFVQFFNFISLKSQLNNNKLSISDLSQFESIFNEKCYDSITMASMGKIIITLLYFLLRILTYILFFNIYFFKFIKKGDDKRAIVSPLFNLVLKGFKNSNIKKNSYNLLYDPSYLKKVEEKEKKKSNDLTEFLESDYHKFMTKKPKFSTMYRTFLSIGDEVQSSIDHFPISLNNHNETFKIPLSDFFLEINQVTVNKIKYEVYNDCGFFIINIPLNLQTKMPQNGETLKYWHARYITSETQSQFEFYMSDKPGFNGLTFIQVIFNKQPARQSMIAFNHYNDNEQITKLK